MAIANLVTESLGKRYSESVIQRTIANAIDDSKRQFTKCYRKRTIKPMTQQPKYPPTPSVEILKKMVEKCGGPAKFARAYSKDDSDDPIDPTFVSQIINGHRPFRDQARLNMARRAGLPDDHFDKINDHKQTDPLSANETPAIYSINPAMKEIAQIMIELNSDRQQQLIGTAKHLLIEQRMDDKNSTERAG